MKKMLKFLLALVLMVSVIGTNTVSAFIIPFPDFPCKPSKPEHTHSYVWVDNGDKTATQTCTCGATCRTTNLTSAVKLFIAVTGDDSTLVREMNNLGVGQDISLFSDEIPNSIEVYTTKVVNGELVTLDYKGAKYGMNNSVALVTRVNDEWVNISTEAMGEYIVNPAELIAIGNDNEALFYVIKCETNGLHIDGIKRQLIEVTPEPTITVTPEPTAEPTTAPAIIVTPEPTTEPAITTTPEPEPEPTDEPIITNIPTQEPVVTEIPVITEEPTCIPTPTATPIIIVMPTATPTPTTEPAEEVATPEPTEVPAEVITPEPTEIPVVEEITPEPTSVPEDPEEEVEIDVPDVPADTPEEPEDVTPTVVPAETEEEIEDELPQTGTQPLGLFTIVGFAALATGSTLIFRRRNR